MQAFSSRDSVRVAQLPGVEQAILSAILGQGVPDHRDRLLSVLVMAVKLADPIPG